MADSALPVATERLKKLIEDAEIEDVTVLWGPPLGDNRPAKLVAVGFGPGGESGDADRDWALIGMEQLNEEITIEICSEASGMDGVDLKASYDTSCSIAAKVEAAIRADDTLGGLLLLEARLSRRRGRYFRHDKTRGHRVFQTLTGTARI